MVPTTLFCQSRVSHTQIQRQITGAKEWKAWKVLNVSHRFKSCRPCSSLDSSFSVFYILLRSLLHQMSISRQSCLTCLSHMFCMLVWRLLPEDFKPRPAYASYIPPSFLSILLRPLLPQRFACRHPHSRLGPCTMVSAAMYAAYKAAEQEDRV
jgi:hypothetical protein